MAETRLPRTSFVEDAPECFIEDGLTFNDTLAGFEPIPKIVTTNCISPIVKFRDSGFFDVATEANQSKNLLKPENQGLNRTLTEANSNLLDPESSEGIEVMVDHKELKEREEIVDQLQKKLSFLRAGGALCTTQLSDEVAAKQKVFEHLSRQLHEKRSAEKVNINSLYRFRKERIDEIGSLIEQYTVEKQNFNDEITSIDRKTQTVKKHLDSISAASTDVVEKYEELKMELMNDKVELDRLKAENSTRREAVSKTNITVRKNKLSTMERLADIADEIEKRNALITRLKENINQPNNHATSGHELNQ